MSLVLLELPDEEKVNSDDMMNKKHKHSNLMLILFFSVLYHLILSGNF